VGYDVLHYEYVLLYTETVSDQHILEMFFGMHLIILIMPHCCCVCRCRWIREVCMWARVLSVCVCVSVAWGDGSVSCAYWGALLPYDDLLLLLEILPGI